MPDRNSGVRVSYQDNKGHEENLTVSDDAVVQSAGKPTVGLIGPNAVNEGGQGNYTLKLDKPTHEDVTVTLEATSYFNGRRRKTSCTTKPYASRQAKQK